MEGYKQIYLNIIQSQATVVDESLSAENIEEFSKMYLFISDYEKWIDNFDNANEITLYKTAIEEYSNALFLLTCGLYRESYIALRFFFEHTLFGLYLSVNDMNYRLWEINKYDMNWSSITDKETGLFCKNFFIAYSPDLIERCDDLLEISKGLYRELSEYIHGNFSTIKTLPAYLKFEKDIFDDISQKISDIQYVITFMFFARYKSILKPEVMLASEDSIMDIIGRFSEVEAFFKKI